MVMWYIPYVGADRVGCRIGRRGDFSSLEPAALARLVDEPEQHSATVQRRLLAGFELVSSFGSLPILLHRDSGPRGQASSGSAEEREHRAPGRARRPRG